MVLYLIQSRKLWLALLAVGLIIAQAANPAFVLDTEEVAGLIVILITAIVALAINPGDPEAKWRDTLTNKSLWMAALGILVIVLKIFIPTFELDTVELAALCITASIYILAAAFDPGDPAMKWAGLLKSRKFWAALVNILMVFMKGFNVVLPFDMTSEQLLGICSVIGAWIAGVAFEGKFETFLHPLIVMGNDKPE